MRTIFLHAGQHKTGTTQIQLALGRAHNRNILYENNFEYPLLSKHSDHQYLHTYLLNNQGEEQNDSDAEVMTQKLLSHIHESNKNIIISAEGLQEVPPEALRKLLLNHHVVVILYIREQAEYLFSAYQQDVKSGRETRSFDEWFYALGPDIGVYYLNTWIATWENAFGAENIIIRRYGKNYLASGDVVSDFLAVVGLPHLASTLAEKTISNSKIDRACHTAMRIINSFGIPQKHISEGTYNALERLSSRPRSLPLGCDIFLVNEIRRRSTWENSILARRRFSDDSLFIFNDIQLESRYSIVEVTKALLKIMALSFSKSPSISLEIFTKFSINFFSLQYLYFFVNFSKYNSDIKCRIRERIIDQLTVEYNRHGNNAENNKEFMDTL